MPDPMWAIWLSNHWSGGNGDRWTPLLTEALLAGQEESFSFVCFLASWLADWLAGCLACWLASLLACLLAVCFGDIITDRVPVLQWTSMGCTMHYIWVILQQMNMGWSREGKQRGIKEENERSVVIFHSAHELSTKFTKNNEIEIVSVAMFWIEFQEKSGPYSV